MNTHMTKSQRRKVAEDPKRRNHWDKWSLMTVGTMNPDGTMTRRTVTASTKRLHDERQFSRRGKDIGHAVL